MTSINVHTAVSDQQIDLKERHALQAKYGTTEAGHEHLAKDLAKAEGIPIEQARQQSTAILSPITKYDKPVIALSFQVPTPAAVPAAPPAEPVPQVQVMHPGMTDRPMLFKVDFGKGMTQDQVAKAMFTDGTVPNGVLMVKNADTSWNVMIPPDNRAGVEGHMRPGAAGAVEAAVQNPYSMSVSAVTPGKGKSSDFTYDFGVPMSRESVARQVFEGGTLPTTISGEAASITSVPPGQETATKWVVHVPDATMGKVTPKAFDAVDAHLDKQKGVELPAWVPADTQATLRAKEIPPGAKHFSKDGHDVYVWKDKGGVNYVEKGKEGGYAWQGYQNHPHSEAFFTAMAERHGNLQPKVAGEIGAWFDRLHTADVTYFITEKGMNPEEADKAATKLEAESAKTIMAAAATFYLAGGGGMSETPNTMELESAVEIGKISPMAENAQEVVMGGLEMYGKFKAEPGLDKAMEKEAEGQEKLHEKAEIGGSGE